jgi:hypothetical protein
MCGKILKGINRGFNWRFIRLKSNLYGTDINNCLPLTFGILLPIAEGEEWRPMITKCEKQCGGDPSVWKYDACVSACLMPWRNLQDTPDKFGPVVDPFSGGFPSPNWALPSNPSGKILFKI